jgi:hypothetical protein
MVTAAAAASDAQQTVRAEDLSASKGLLFLTVVLQFWGPVSDMPNLSNEFTAEFTPDASRTALN